LAIVVLLVSLAVMFLPVIYVPPSFATGFAYYDSVNFYFGGWGGQHSSNFHWYTFCWPKSWPLYTADDCQTWQLS
jgi:hypothetical protein